MYYDTISHSYLTITCTFLHPTSLQKKANDKRGVHRQQGFLCIVSIYLFNLISDVKTVRMV